MTAECKSINFWELSLFFVSFFLFFSSQAQDTFTGCWVGHIEQLENGETKRYPYQVCLEQNDQNLQGVSYIQVQEAHANMRLEGSTIGTHYLHFQEVKILEAKAYPDSEWCLKKVRLRLRQVGEQQVLEGVWQGKVSFGDCTPGTMRLEKMQAQA